MSTAESTGFSCRQDEFSPRRNPGRGRPNTGSDGGATRHAAERRWATKGKAMHRTSIILALAVFAMAHPGAAQQPPPPCHANPSANQDMASVGNRGDI